MRSRKAFSTWDDKETGQKRYATEIKARDLRMLGGRPDGPGGPAGAGSSTSDGAHGGVPPVSGDAEDDVPF